MRTVFFIADAWQILRPGDMLTFLGCVAVLLGIALTAKTLFFRSGPISPQPLIVALEKEFVGKPEFQKFERYVHESHTELRDELDAISDSAKKRDAVLATLEERSKNVETNTGEIKAQIRAFDKNANDRINSVLTAVSRLEGHIESMNRRPRN